MPKAFKRGLVSMALMIPLSGCASNFVGIADVCGSWQRIMVSKSDVLTKRTAKEILGNNAAHAAVCKGEGNG